MLDPTRLSGSTWAVFDQLVAGPSSPSQVIRPTANRAASGSAPNPTAANDIERLTAELERIRAERDRLFRVAVNDDQLEQYGVAGSCTQSESIARVLEWLKTFDLPDGDVAAALTEHDRRASL